MADAISLKKQSSDWLKNATWVAGGGIKANKNSSWLISWIRNVSEYAVLINAMFRYTLQEQIAGDFLKNF